MKPAASRLPEIRCCSGKVGQDARREPSLLRAVSPRIPGDATHVDDCDGQPSSRWGNPDKPLTFDAEVGPALIGECSSMLKWRPGTDRICGWPIRQLSGAT
jgi:hypothetical protein